MGVNTVEVRDLSTRFGSKRVHDAISLDVPQGEITAIVGGSGSGKSTLLREMALLQQPTSGQLRVFETEIRQPVLGRYEALRRRIGVLFQQGALFGDLSVLDNVALPLQEHARLSRRSIEELAMVKLGLVGLEPETAFLAPSQLSGGMHKRAALARAIALDPELLYLDEPVSGLDPITADALDDLVLKLKESLGLTIVMVTHDMDSLWRVADRVVLLAEGRVLGCGSMDTLAASEHPKIQHFFRGPRGRAAQAAAWKHE